MTETRFETIFACRPNGLAEPVPIALGCGHLASGRLRFTYEADAGCSTVDCPEGCGEQHWVNEPLLAPAPVLTAS